METVDWFRDATFASEGPAILRGRRKRGDSGGRLKQASAGNRGAVQEVDLQPEVKPP